MFGSSWKIGRIAGIDLRIDTSWLLIAFFIGYTFFVRFDFLYEDLAADYMVLLAVASTLVFFGSVLAHEFAHALVAQARGIPVHGITLFLFGGATEAEVESKSARDEFVIAAVGPLTSIGVASVFGVAAFAIGDVDEPVPGTIGYLAWVNLALAAFNMLPGLPLDGGRLLRSTIWGFTGKIEQATRVAARSGQVIGWALAALGILLLFAGAGGLWLIFVGWFLAQAAKASYVQLRVRRLLAGTSAATVMTPDLVCVEGDVPLDDVVRDYFLRYDHSSFPVVEGGEVIGLLTLRAVRRSDPDRRPELRARDCMTPLAQADAVRPDTPLSDVVDLLARDGDDADKRVLVRRSGPDGVVGIISPGDVTRWLQRAEELEVREEELQSAPPGTWTNSSQR